MSNKELFTGEFDYMDIIRKLKKDFKDRGLTYDDITPNKFYQLVGLLAEEFETFDWEQKLFISSGCNKPSYHSYDKSINMPGSFIKVSSGYFKGRDAISFWENGDITFCSWASRYTNKPFIKAFIRWMDKIKPEKER